MMSEQWYARRWFDPLRESWRSCGEGDYVGVEPGFLHTVGG